MVKSRERRKGKIVYKIGVLKTKRAGRFFNKKVSLNTPELPNPRPNKDYRTRGNCNFQIPPGLMETV